MEMLLEKLIIYSLTGVVCLAVVIFYIRKKNRESKIVDEKIKKAKEAGLHEPVSLHPYVDVNACIQTGACIAACPEKDILGIKDGKATIINASRCIGHGACFHACPTEAISLRIGSEKRGVDLPHVSQNFETNVSGIFIAGELGGMGLIKNAVEQGRQAVENIIRTDRRGIGNCYDLIIIGAGPAGISGALTAKKHGLNFMILEQDTLGGTVYTFPRKKIVMTSPMEIPLYGKIRLFETSKSELLTLWEGILGKNNITVAENSKVESVSPDGNKFSVKTLKGDTFTSASVLLAIGRRGTPRKLGIPGENSEKVAYRLLEPEDISGKSIVVVGGGDSAIESAFLLKERNNIILSYRGENFSRIKPGNYEILEKAMSEGKIDVRLKSNLIAIEDDYIYLSHENGGEPQKIKNDLVYIFAGGELPTQFLEKAGVRITRKFGETVMKH